MITVEQVCTILSNAGPSHAGYESEFEFDQHGDNVLLTFKPDWLPNYMESQYLIVAIDGTQITYCSVNSSGWAASWAEPKTTSVEEFYELLRDYGN